MGKAPYTILTDQDQWLTKAIKSQRPNTKYGFCIRHITTKFSGWFLSTLCGTYFKWCIENEWFMTASKYNLHANKHVIGLYNIRKYWVPSFLRGYFFGGMTTTERSESINAFVKRFIYSNITLGKFLKQILCKQRHDIMLDKHRFPNLKIISPLEDQAQKILTQYTFNMIKEQLERESHFSVISRMSSNFVMQYFKESATTIRRKVFWDGKVTNCSYNLSSYIECLFLYRLF
ncbi:hypothetical protein MKX01_010797 [Papaver californicum]|nr:hypothetical protein MKX01_010797 [Papaver californicum]